MRIVLVFLLLALNVSSHAFDPGGPPPKKTLSWTASYASRVVIPRIRYKNETPEAAIRHLLGVSGIPPEYSITVDATKLSNPATVTFDADNITLLQALSRIAEQVHADLLIRPGSITLQPQ